jgi:hypothetical protein
MKKISFLMLRKIKSIGFVSKVARKYRMLLLFITTFIATISQNKEFLAHFLNRVANYAIS